PAMLEDGTVTVGPAPAPTSTYTPGPSPTPTETPTPGPSPTPTPTATFGPGTTAVVIDPASQQVLVGQQFTVDVMAQNISNLGAYEFTLRFNPNVINYESVANGDFLGSTGRSVFCPAPIADGWILRFGCVTTGVGIPGASGSGQLAQVFFQAAAPGAIRLDLSAVALADPLGVTINAAIASGSVTVLATGATSGGSDFRPGFLAAAAVLTGTVGLLLRPASARAESRRFGRMRRRWRPSSGTAWDGRRMVGFMKSLWRRIIT
ncbi:MAG: cohesin domain-containing protein, partial [Dehalococcoidia bacterium]|nr:cohesin domain-containing protein [Dehalococcoidia bacterium]